MLVSLVRHAIAEDRDEFRNSGGVSDEDRPLTKKGIDKMMRGSRGISALCPGVELILTSPLERATHTAEILQSAFSGIDLKTCDELKPEYEVDQLFSSLSQFSDLEHILLVGHEPNLTEFINFSLTPGTERIFHIKKGSLATLSFESIPQKGTARLKCWIQPAQLRQLAKNLNAEKSRNP